MAILKNKTQGLYVNVAKSAIMDQNLSLRDRGMLVTILSLPDSWEFNVKGFSKILPDGVDGIRASIKELEDRGYLTREQERATRGKFGKNVIEIHEIPIPPQLDYPYTAKPSTVSPYTDSPLPENPTQLNNKQLSNNKLNNQSIYLNRMNDGETSMQSNFSRDENVETEAEAKIRVTEELKMLIDYDLFVLAGDGGMVDALLDYMSEIVATGADFITKQRKYNASFMKAQFYKLNRGAIQYVLRTYNKVTEEQEIRNKKNYLIQMLVTAQSDMLTSTVGAVNYDMAHWHERGDA